MTYYLLKLFISAGIIVAVSEIAKFNAPLGALIKSLPLVSLLAILWIYLETQDTQKIAELSSATFWLVLPTLPMFLALPALLRAGWGFYPALALSVAIMVACYAVALPVLARFGMSI